MSLEALFCDLSVEFLPIVSHLALYKIKNKIGNFFKWFNKKNEELPNLGLFVGVWKIFVLTLIFLNFRFFDLNLFELSSESLVLLDVDIIESSEDSLDELEEVTFTKFDCLALREGVS